MALGAHPRCNRLVHGVVENAAEIGPVRIMTVGTAALCHRIVHMLLGEDRPIRFMTPETEARDIFFEERRPFARSVRIMAGRTPLGDRCVFELGLGGLVDELGMALGAKIVTILAQIVPVGGGMRIMALDAVAVGDHLMGADRLGREDLGVAGKADGLLLRRQKLLPVRSMGTVTTDTVLLLERGMDTRLLQGLLEAGMTADAEFTGGTGFKAHPFAALFSWCRRAEERGQE